MTAKTAPKTRKPKQTVKQRDKLRSLAAKADSTWDMGEWHSRGYLDCRARPLSPVPEGLTHHKAQAWRYGWLECYHVMRENQDRDDAAEAQRASVRKTSMQEASAEPKASEPKSFLSRLWKWVRG